MKEIKLTQGKVALVDDEDFEELSKFKWCALKAPKTYYAIRRGNDFKKSTIYMHREILKLTDSKIQGEHKDNNGLNNQKSNLRTCTNSENQRNKTCKINGTSNYKGVYWNKKNKKWDVRICINKKRTYVGHFKNEIEAAKAYDKKAKELFGEFAYLNFKD